MDKIEIQASRLNDLIHRIIMKDNPKFYSEIEVALTAAHTAGWDEGVEAARNRAASSKYRGRGDCSESIAQAIRRLKKGV